MVMILNAVLYVVALVLSFGALRTAVATDSRRVRAARIVLVCGGGLAIATAIALSFLRLWIAAGVAGCLAIIIVGTALWFALTSRAPQRGEEDDDEQHGGGGPRKRPEPPAPPEPAGGPSLDVWTTDRADWTDWSRFDRARATWEQERKQVGA